MTLQNSPVVYRVVVTPPGIRIKKWTGEIYLDTNQSLKDFERTQYSERLNKTSR